MNNTKLSNAIISQIEIIKEKCERIKPVVEIRCFTYNQSTYIKDALEGFVKQRTSFPFVAIVHDDASDDGTAEIIKQYANSYPDIILPIIEEENQYSKKDGSLGNVIREASKTIGSKYIAWCEGDDYWIDPLKLQTQVDFLEMHPDYGMCYTKVKRYIEKAKCFKDIWGGENTSFAQLIKKNTIPTLTVLIKSDTYRLYNSQIKPENHNWKMGDYPIWLYCAHESKVGFLDITTGVYRVLENSASHHKNYLSRLEFSLSGNSILSYFLNYFNEDTEEKDCVDFHISYIEMRIALLKEENENKAIKSFRKAFRSSFQWWKKYPLMIGWYMIPRILSELSRIRYRMLH